ncbi:MAG: NADH-quinone oxidoreductase subunit M, partial [Bacteroidia bacterium]|nr:NADH-quinone oxidoreductase subunit M [Bacteroidia bacterium]
MPAILFLPLVALPLVLGIRKSVWLQSLCVCVFAAQAVLSAMFFSESFDYPWLNIPIAEREYLNIRFALRIDGLNVLLLSLTYLVMTICVVVTPTNISRPKAYYALMLLSSFLISGCFLTTDLFLFFLFFEATLLPMFFLIGVWGGERRRYAAVKFFVFTFAGSIFFLLALFPMAFASVDWNATAQANASSIEALGSMRNAVWIRSL